MTRTVTATCTISFSVGETTDPARVITLAYAGEELVVVQDHGTFLTVRKNGNDAVPFVIYPGQYQ